MEHIEQAYADLGLPSDANRNQVERRYHNVVRRLRAKELRGTLSMMDEIQLRSVNKAFRSILNAENTRLVEEYRKKHYGKYKRYSVAAEKIDHFLTYYNFIVVGCVLLLLFGILGVVGFRHLLHEQSVAASLPVPDLSLMIAIDEPPNDKYTTGHSIEQRLLPLWPTWKHIESTYHSLDKNSSMQVLTGNPDLYILDRDQFIKLLRVGYLRRLDQWGTYGVDLSNGALARTLNLYGKPLIAAVGVNSERPENAIQFIQHFVDDTYIELEANKVFKSSSSD